MNGKPVDAFLNLALPVFLPRCRARAKANQALPLELSTVVPLEDADWCLDCKPPFVHGRDGQALVNHFDASRCRKQIRRHEAPVTGV